MRHMDCPGGFERFFQSGTTLQSDFLFGTASTRDVPGRAHAEASPLMTPTALKSYSHKDLAQMAKQGGVRGWHSMRKDQLVKALLTTVKPKATKKVATPARRSPAKAITRPALQNVF